ncbi:hypothetical protein AAY473_019938 [Plecturocebus cupreus]
MTKSSQKLKELSKDFSGHLVLKKSLQFQRCANRNLVKTLVQYKQIGNVILKESTLQHGFMKTNMGQSFSDILKCTGNFKAGWKNRQTKQKTKNPGPGCAWWLMPVPCPTLGALKGLSDPQKQLPVAEKGKRANWKQSGYFIHSAKLWRHPDSSVIRLKFSPQWLGTVAHACNPSTLGYQAFWEVTGGESLELLGRLRQEIRLNSGSRGCIQQRSCHCTPAWVKARLRLKTNKQ